MKPLFKALVSTSIAVALTLVAATTPALAAKPKWAKKADVSIVDFAVNASGGIGNFDNDGEDFDILVQALVDTGTIAVFNGSAYTVFAPNDQAFYDLTGTENDTDAYNAVLGLLSVEQVGAVLAYHVTKGVRNSRTVTRAKEISTLLEGETISGRSGMLEANFSTAAFLDLDNRLQDGMVHTIDTVLLPIDPLASP